MPRSIGLPLAVELSRGRDLDATIAMSMRRLLWVSQPTSLPRSIDAGQVGMASNSGAHCGRGAALLRTSPGQPDDMICVCLIAGYRGRPVQPGRPTMRSCRIAVSAAFAAGLAALPVATAKAQYYPPCSPFPLFWPFCVAGAPVGTAPAIVPAPFPG